MEIRRKIRIAAAVLLIPLFCLLGATEAFACTGVYVGPEASADGTTIIARSNDIHPTVIPTIVKVYDRVENQPGRVFDCRNGFSWPLPDTTYRYVCIPQTTAGQKITDSAQEDAAGASNECGLAVSATVTGYICEAANKADPPVEEGICEFDMAGLIASSCKTAREGVELLAQIIDECGTFEQNIIMITDAKEAWYMETYTGHQYAAVKMPRDCVAVFGNEFMLGDIEEGYEDVIVSPELYSLPEKEGFAEYNEDGHMDLFDTYAGRGRLADYANARTWVGHWLFAPSSAGEYVTKDRYPLFYKPDAPVCLQDVMGVFRNRYEGTPLDAKVNDSDKIRVIATETQAHVHILQRYPDLPDELAVVNWCALSGAEYTPFVPLFSAMTDVSDPFALDLKTDDFNPDSAFMIFKALKTLCAQNRDLYGPQVAKYWDSAESRMVQDVPALLDDANNEKDADKAAEILTGYSLKCQEAAYDDATALYGDVLRNIMLNTDTLQYVLNYDTLEYEPKQLTPLKLSVNPLRIRSKYGY
ncbi:MAG: C69 family dipeptidase [Lachnospiraceae bacterium]|nr:C69 family dipeptidase [Lachnospiraceae bacterium]